MNLLKPDIYIKIKDAIGNIRDGKHYKAYKKDFVVRRCCFIEKSEVERYWTILHNF